MNVAVSGTALNFPRLCACCGEASETTLPVTDSTRIGNMRYTSTWQLPYCNGCAAHVKHTSMRGWEMLLLLVTVGLYLVSYYLFYRPMRIRAAKQSMMKPSCAGHDLPSYKYFKVGNGKHIFEFKNPTFAKAFVLANQASLDGASPEIKQLIAGS